MILLKSTLLVSTSERREVRSLELIGLRRTGTMLISDATDSRGRNDVTEWTP